MIRELERLLERPAPDAAVQHLTLRLRATGALALDGEDIALRGQGKLVAAEPGDGQDDPVGVLAGPLDVIRREPIVGLPDLGRGLQEVEHVVEAHGRAKQRSKIEVLAHHHILQQKQHGISTAPTDPAPAANPLQALVIMF